MASLNESVHDEKNKILEKDLEDFSLLPEIQNGSFLIDNNFAYQEEITSPKIPLADEAPSLLFPPLADTENGDEYSEFFYILNPINGDLEEAGPSNVNLNNEEYSPTFEESTEVVPAKKLKRELTLYEETLLKEFSAEIDKEQKLLAEEHAMKMKLWDLEMQASQQQHALKMAILKEELEKIQQEKLSLQYQRNIKISSKFKSGPI